MTEAVCRITSDDSKTCHYSKEKLLYIRLVHIIGIILWLALVYLLELYRTDLIGILILIVPIFMPLVGISNVCYLTREMEGEVFQVNVLSMSIILVLPFLSWVSRGHIENKSQYIKIVVIAIMISLFTMLDFWVTREWLSVIRHIKSILETMALVLVIYAMYTFYITYPEDFLS